MRFRLDGKKSGWLGVVSLADRIDIAHVVREAGSRPEVRLFESFRNEGDFSAALVRLRASHKLHLHRCTTLLGHGDYHLAQQEAPEVPAEERADALRWRMRDIVDYPVEAASIGVLDIPVEGQPSGRKGSVFVAMAPGEVVSRRMTDFAQAKVPLAAIDLPELAQRNVSALFEEANRGLAFLSLDQGGGLLTVTYRGELYAFRHIDISSRQLVEAAEERRAQLLERIVLELQRSLDTFDRQYSFVPVARLVVSCDAGIEELVARLAENLYVPVQAMDLATVLDFSTLPELRAPQRQAQGLAAIGAALREEAA